MKKIYMILAAITLLSMSLNAQTTANGKVEILPDGYFRMGPSRASTTPVTPPYSNGFDSDDEWNWWETINNNGDSYTWSLSSGTAQIRWNSSQAADDWLVTAPVYLEAGKNYKFYIDTWAYSSSYTERLEVKMASANTNAALSAGTSIIASTDVTWTSSQTLSNLNVTVSTSGNYYFGIHGISAADKYYLYVDNFVIDVDITDPTIQTSTNSVEMNAAPGASATQTVTVTGLNLTEGITATLSDANGVFSVSPASLGASGGDLTITYSPSAEGTHTATITLASAGADPVTINITGTSAAGTTYVMVTDPSTQLVADKKYIVVGNSKYAMGALSATSGFGTPVPITDNGNGTVTVAATESPMVLTLHEYSSTYTSGYTFTLDNGSYLRPYSSSSTNLTTTTATSDQNCWITTADVKPTGGYAVKWNYLATNRALAFRESSSVSARFCYYATSNMTAASTEYFYGLLYVEDTSTPPTPTPELTAPANGTTVNVGTNEGSGVSTTITVSGNDLTQDLTVSVSGAGFSVTPTTITAADANAGTTITVTYDGTVANATGTLTISSGEVSTTVNLTATYVDITPVLTAPANGSTVNVGTNTGSGVSTTVTVSGNNLTQDLTVSVSGEGFEVTPTTITAADANAGATVTVTYTGTTENATGTLTITSGEVSVTVNLTASYDESAPVQVPELITPVDGSTVFVGTTSVEEPSVSKVIAISGNYLTKDLTATISGEGFSFLTRDMTVPYADVNAATASVTVVYSGTAENATGTLTLSSDEVSATVNLTASYRKPVVLTTVPAGYVAQDSKSPDEIATAIIETFIDNYHGDVVSVTYVNSLGMTSDKPFDGVNIVVTRYSDGTTSTSKVIR